MKKTYPHNVLFVIIMLVINLYPIIANGNNKKESNLIYMFEKALKKEQKSFSSDDQNLYNKDFIKKKLNYMAKIDQMVREMLFIPTIKIDPSFKNHKQVLFIVDKIDHINSEDMYKILSIYQWLKLSEFGKDCVTNAWLIVQHSKDRSLQHKVLFLLEKFLEQNEAIPEHYVYLYDQVCMVYNDLGIKQRYGTQFLINYKGDIVIQPYDGDLDQLNDRRNKLGLSDINTYVKNIKSMYKKN